MKEWDSYKGREFWGERMRREEGREGEREEKRANGERERKPGRGRDLDEIRGNTDRNKGGKKITRDRERVRWKSRENGKSVYERER